MPTHTIRRWPASTIAATLVGSALLAVAFALLPPARAADNNVPMLNPTAAGVWDRLQQLDYRKTFKHFPGRTAFYKGTEPHGALLTTYVNDLALAALEQKLDRLPYGAMVVKENYSPARKLASTTVMVKVVGYDPDNNDWFWMKRLADGRVEASGKVASCAKCHGLSQGDFIRTPLP
jgi:hypothetical protein